MTAQPKRLTLSQLMALKRAAERYPFTEIHDMGWFVATTLLLIAEVEAHRAAERKAKRENRKERKP